VLSALYLGLVAGLVVAAAIFGLSALLARALLALGGIAGLLLLRLLSAVRVFPTLDGSFVAGLVMAAAIGCIRHVVYLLCQRYTSYAYATLDIG